MKYMDVKAITASLAVFASAIWGPLNGALMALLILMAIDYASGVTQAVINKNLNSEVGYRGLMKKFFILLLVALAHIVDVHILKTGDLIRSGTCFYYIANEGISIVENAAKIGLPVPKKIKSILEQLKEEDSE